MFKQINSVLEKNMNQTLKRDDLTSAQADILMALGESSAGIKLKDLEAHLMLAQSTIAGTVSRLEKKGLITYADSSDDKRVKIVLLTDAGRKIVSNSVEVRSQVEEQIFNGMSPSERDMLLVLLQKVRTNLK